MRISIWMTGLIVLGGTARGAATVHLGDPAPPLTIAKTLNAPAGTVAAWPALRGNAVVLEFWATWCAPCVDQIPHLNRLSEQFRDSKVIFLSVTYEDEALVTRFTAKHPIGGWIGLDQGRATHGAFGVNPIPRTFLIDAEGVLRGITRPERVGAVEIRQLLAGKNVTGAADSFSPEPSIDIGAGPKPLTMMLIRPTEGNTGKKRSSRGGYEAFGVSLKDLLATANGVPPARVIGPDWLSDGAWDVAFSVPPALASGLWPLARQALATTFQIQEHREPREVEVLVMTVVEGRTPTLKRSPEGVKTANYRTKTSGGVSSGIGTGWTLAMFGRTVLGKVYDQPVVDETGLEGRYDFELTVKGNSPEAHTTALREQLGLDVHLARKQMDHIVIDRAVRPEADATK
jgi:uncharacterized protein (TIGR03435 family)